MATKKESHSPMRDEIVGVLLVAFALFAFIASLTFTDGRSNDHFLGMIGYATAFAISYIWGLLAFPFLIGVAFLGVELIRGKNFSDLKIKLSALLLFLVAASFLFTIIAERDWIDLALFRRYTYSELIFLPCPYPHTVARINLGGVPFYFLYKDLPPHSLRDLLSDAGLAITSIMMGSYALTVFFGISLRDLFNRKKESEPKEAETVFDSVTELYPERAKVRRRAMPKEPITCLEVEEPLPPPPKVVKNLPPKKVIELPEPPQAKKASPSGYDLPTAGLLSASTQIDAPSLAKDLKRLATILEETLASFGIEAKVGQIHSGPTITSLEVHPAIGVKVQKITALASDIALNMQAKSIRIIAPIPGKAAVGVEVPSPYPQEVGFKEMLQNYRKQGKKCLIPVLLGKTVTGEEVVADLAKMPHCIIAGATGSGKSVCINTMIMSILMNATPEEIRLILIDPKKVELTPFSRLPHLIAPVITEPEEAHKALQWIVGEMERRYDLLKQLGLRNITAFNHRTINPEVEAALNLEIPEQMPMIVAIIDEFADLMMTSSADLETPIARIAQMARAVGIHLVLATQRPSREVITGIIKANFPTRIAFKVASRVNSQIILDENGAETLLGNGDMLFLPPGSSQLIRAQGVYIRDEDIHKIVASIEARHPPRYLFSSFDRVATLSDCDEDGPKDTLYDEALKTVLETGNASTTFLQRKLKVGYARAASLIDELERRGIVSAADGAKPRRILVKAESEE